MDLLQSLWQGVRSLIPAGIAVAGIILVLFGLRYFLEKHYAGSPGLSLRRQLMTLLVLLAGLLVVILVFPISDTTRGQLLSLIGIVLSAAIALSSTTFIGNAMAGLMLRAVRSFRPGDFIRVGEYFGRVSERGLFHIEIQTEDRDLTTLPNLYLVTNPVKVIRSSGTVVTAEVSLGYDIPRTEVERLLLKAAEATGLREPFVYVINLGDFSVTYRIAGLLTEIKHLLSTRSQLHEMMLDGLHQGGIEIVSPSFMNTRALPEDRSFIPRSAKVYHEVEKPHDKPAPEEIVFDKAEEAESLEKLRERLNDLANQTEELKELMEQTQDENEKEKLKLKIQQLEDRREGLADYINLREGENKDK
jgi:small-conductance mechanosensitive channel